MATLAITTFQKTVTTAGTPVQLPDNPVEDSQTIVVKAKSANTGSICVGNSSANALQSATLHFKLAAGAGISLKVDNANRIWIDTTINGEGVECVIA